MSVSLEGSAEAQTADNDYLLGARGPQSGLPRIPEAPAVSSVSPDAPSPVALVGGFVLMKPPAENPGFRPYRESPRRAVGAASEACVRLL